jgi:hypothetical protein
MNSKNWLLTCSRNAFSVLVSYCSLGMFSSNRYFVEPAAALLESTRLREALSNWGRKKKVCSSWKYTRRIDLR